MAFYDYQLLNEIYSSYNPSTIHVRNTGLTRYYKKYLLQKLMSRYEFTGLPENWAENYFLYCLFGFGYLAVFDSEQFGVIPQHGTIGGELNVFYQPKYMQIANPVLKSIKRLEIGKDCEILRLQPDYSSPMDIVSYYAQMLALCAETAGNNLVNSKLAYVFRVSNKAMAETMKKMYDAIASGEPAVVYDKSLTDNFDGPAWDTFAQNLSQNYIAGQVMDDMTKWVNMFDTEIGIPNANTEKRERLIVDEVNANNFDTYSKAELWLKTMKKDLSKINDRYGLNIGVEFRALENIPENEEEEDEEIYENTDIIDSGTL